LETGGSKLMKSKGSQAIFVMDEEGQIFISKTQKYGKLHHSSLLAGRPAAMAGEIEIKDGKIISFNNQSGHYKPGPQQVENFQRRLKELGVDLDTIKHAPWGR
jgi:hypothetical protein